MVIGRIYHDEQEGLYASASECRIRHWTEEFSRWNIKFGLIASRLVPNHALWSFDDRGVISTRYGKQTIDATGIAILQIGMDGRPDDCCG